MADDNVNRRKLMDQSPMLVHVQAVPTGDYELDSVALMLAASRMCGDPAVRLRVLDYVVARTREEVRFTIKGE